jgi:ATP-dependent RNA helicase DeaD
MTSTAAAEGLHPALARALAQKGYETLTEVQAAMLSPDLLGQDLLVSAKTGSGKTVGFGVAIGPDLLGDEERLPEASLPSAIIVAPTRELAMQVAKELTWLYGPAGAKVATCVGGMDMRSERQVLSRGAHIIVGTPGRLVDHISRGSLDLAALKVAVLDEADEMLKLGFRDELEAILDACPEGRRTLMFSATVGGGIAKLAGRFQQDAVRVSLASPAEQHGDIAYRALLTAQFDTERAIINTLRYYEAENAIVFCSTRAAVARLTSRLANRGLSVVSMSGELTQTERSHALQAMRDGRARVCVATDVAARGIDLPGLELVIHADLPKNREGLLHRSGRTGRAGRKGTSVLIVPPKARRFIERLLFDAKVEAEWGNPPSADEVRAKDEERLLESPALNEPKEATELARTLAASHPAEQLAAALIELHLQGRSAPEELSVVEPLDKVRERPIRREDADAVWVTLSVGRKKKAEPRWLLPMLCKAGGLTKGAIGAIRVLEHETFVGLDPHKAAAFLGRIKEDSVLEDGISVALADGPPSQTRPEGKESFSPRSKPDRPKKPWKPREERGASEPAPSEMGGEQKEKSFKRRPKAKPGAASAKTPAPYKKKEGGKPFKKQRAADGSGKSPRKRPG